MCTYVVIIQNSKSKRAKIAKKSIKCITLNLEKLRLHTPHYYFQYRANILSSKGPTFLGKWTSTNSVLNTKKVSLNSSSGWRVFKRGFVQVKTQLLSTFLNEFKYTNMHFNNDYRSTNFSPSYMLIFVRADKILSVHKFLKHHGCSPLTAIFYKYGKATMRIF